MLNMVLGQLPPDNCHPDNCHLGQLPPTKTATYNNCHLGQLPPRTIATRETAT